ncbi:DNA primase [Pseudobdellovibrio exovorus]|uniref:DNA primase n=1 Tax=Pseudobdellovibrio exovorus JSS TaxID=1184267 RepID=M4V5K8_9BACT|nr:DNA primase [Pseudobdellovibrio exovorus]AGH94637.1 DNA primase [Pseudobdellovibrio exovorus JSS]
MRYSPEFVDRVQEANNLVDIISQYTQLKQSGGGYMGRCPFPDHAEKTASFSVSESKQVFHCFGCKKSGNLFSFLRDYNGMSFPEAVEYLAERASIPLPEPVHEAHNDHYHEQQDKKKLMLKANKTAMEFFREMLKRAPNDHPIKAYVQKRKLQPETLEEFHIGFAPDEWEALSNHLHRQKVPAALAEEAKLVKARKEGNGHFDLFRDRLMFPILSPTQEVLAFGGRIHAQGEPKYLNSPETPVFNKSRVLYGLAHTAKYIRSEDAVIIVEGYMDLVSLFQAGLKNVAATMGTALTAEHAKLIKRLTTNVVVLFDGDEAGQRAAERSLPLLLAAGLYPKGLVLTEAKDPDEYVSQFGMESLKAKIDTSPELFNMVLQMWMRDYRGEAAQKVKLMDLVRPVFEAIPDPRLKSLYAQELSHRMNVGLDWVRSALSSASSNRETSRNWSADSRADVRPDANSEVKKPATTAANEPKKPVFSISGSSQAEVLLMQLALKSRANFQTILDQQILSQISHLGVKKLLENAEQVYRQDVAKFDRLTSLLIEQVDRPELLFSTVANSVDFDTEKENKMIADCCKRIQQTFLKEQAKRIALGINKNDIDKLKEIDDLQRNRISLNKTDKN